MVDHLLELIQQEANKLRVLKQEVARREQRVAMLTAMRDGDKFDEVLNAAVQPARPFVHDLVLVPATSAALTPEVTFDEGGAQKQRPRGQVKRALLNALTTEPSGIDDVQQRALQEGLELNYNHVRTQLWALSKDKDQYVVSPSKGLYQLTDHGAAYVHKLKGESPGATGLSSATKSSADEL